MSDCGKIDAGLLVALRAWETGDRSPDAGISVTLRFEGDLAAIEALGFVTHRAGDGEAIGVVHFKHVDRLTDFPAVLWISAGRPRRPHLDTAVADIKARATTVANVGSAGDGLWHVATAGGAINQAGNATGSGVIVAILDTGIDYKHPMFLRTQGPPKASRILRIWDMGLTPTVVTECPDSALTESTERYGVEFKNVPGNMQIDNAVNAPPNLRHRDCEGHGTHVAGIAAGGNLFGPNGDTSFMGVAPEADIIAVKLLDTPDVIHYFTAPAVEVGWDVQFRDAVLYCLRTARLLGKPIVINMSFGASGGPGDGLDAESIWMDSLLDPAAVAGPMHFPTGAIIVQSCGNDGDPVDRISAKITIPAGGEVVVPLLLFDTRGVAQTTVQNCLNLPYHPPISANFWYRRANPFDSVKFALRYPDSAGFGGDMPVGGNLHQGFGLRVGPPRLTVLMAPAANTHQARVTNGGEPAVAHPAGGTVRRHNLVFTIEPKVVGANASYYTGIYEMRIEAPVGTEIYLMCDQLGWGPGQFVGFQAHDRLINGDPINAAINVSPNFSLVDAGGQHVIAVASYDDEDGPTRGPHPIVASSSRGPLRDYSDPARLPFVVKPDVAAPGSDIMSAMSIDSDHAGTNAADADWQAGRRFIEFGGTSMAAPLVAGLIALMLDKNPNLTPTQVRTALTSVARTGGAPTASPDRERAFGAGMVDALRTHGITP